MYGLLCFWIHMHVTHELSTDATNLVWRLQESKVVML